MCTLPPSSSAEDLIRSGWRFNRIVRAINQARTTFATPLTEKEISGGWTEERKAAAMALVDDIAAAVDERAVYRQDARWIGSEWGYKGGLHTWHSPHRSKTDEWKDAMHTVMNVVDDYIVNGERFLRMVLHAIEVLEHAGGCPRNAKVTETYERLKELVSQAEPLDRKFPHPPGPRAMPREYVYRNQEDFRTLRNLEHLMFELFPSLMKFEHEFTFTSDLEDEESRRELQVLIPLLRHLAEKFLRGERIRQEDFNAFHRAVIPLGDGHSWFNAEYSSLGTDKSEIARSGPSTKSTETTELKMYLEDLLIPLPWRAVANVHGNLEGAAWNKWDDEE